MKRRDQFLIAMYRELMNDINRHIVVVWQSIATLIAAVAAFSFVKEGVLSLDIAAAILVVVGFWVSLHVQDAGYWYNRNLAMISNIERQFLKRSDQKNIHYYFGVHRPKNKILTHLRVQELLAFGIVLVALGIQLDAVLLPILKGESPKYFLAFLPWLLVIIGLIIRHRLRTKYEIKYKEFITNSPGIKVDTRGIDYGVGHGFDKKKK